MGPGYFFHDPSYTRLVRTAIDNTNKIQGLDPRRWWRIFHISLKSRSIEYGIHKKQVQNKLKLSLNKELEKLEIKNSNDPLDIDRTSYLNLELKKLLLKEIEGYKVRLKGLPTHEQKEPNIQFYADMEKRNKTKSVIHKLTDTDGSLHSDKHNLLRITSKFYTDLYTPSPTCSRKQQKLIQNLN